MLYKYFVYHKLLVFGMGELLKSQEFFVWKFEFIIGSLGCASFQS